MSTAKVQFFSDALGKWASYNVILPETGEGPFPVLMQLHGLTDDAGPWTQRSNLYPELPRRPRVRLLAADTPADVVSSVLDCDDGSVPIPS